MTNGTMRLFQIREDDLATLEQLVPALMRANYRPGISNATKAKIRQVRDVLSKVRWEYGPPQSVEIIPLHGPIEPHDPMSSS